MTTVCPETDPGAGLRPALGPFQSKPISRFGFALRRRPYFVSSIDSLPALSTVTVVVRAVPPASVD